MQNNICGSYNIDGTFKIRTENSYENFGNSQSSYLELQKIAIPKQTDGLCDPYDSNKPYDLCLLESTFKNNICLKN